MVWEIHCNCFINRMYHSFMLYLDPFPVRSLLLYLWISVDDNRIYEILSVIVTILINTNNCLLKLPHNVSNHWLWAHLRSLHLHTYFSPAVSDYRLMLFFRLAAPILLLAFAYCSKEMKLVYFEWFSTDFSYAYPLYIYLW